MPEYKAPMRDMQFVLHEVFNLEQHYNDCGYDDCGRDMTDAVLEEGAKFAEQKLAPLRQIGDEVGATWKDGVVTTAPGFKDAYLAFCEAGWPSLSADPNYGGQGLPHSLGIVLHEMCFTANIGWCASIILTQGAHRALTAHASDELKNLYLPKMTDGSWTGTMCLTEPHAGTDLGILRTKSEPHADHAGDGSYAITGTKIFITFGEHDMTENIVHLVLAKLPDAPAGPKGISLFVVPKFLPDADGNPGERNAVSCASIEHKMGLKASPTCVLNFDGAKGWLVGKEHGGLAAMFTMMNAARLDVGIEGLAAGELSFQGAYEYARERLQSRSLSGPKAPDKPADPIIVHADVRRMLLTQKAFNEGCRAMIYFIAMQLDNEAHAPNEEARKLAGDLVALLIPIHKAFTTDRGLESASLGVQVFGGHGYIGEHGMEQIMRDVRIALLYEGTNGIQALDLMGRKTAGSGGRLLQQFTDGILAFCSDHGADDQLSEFIGPLTARVEQWLELTESILERAQDDPEVIGAAAVDYCAYSGYVTLAYFWARMAATAREKLDTGTDEAAFYEAKLHTARFYFEHLLPRANAHRSAAQAPTSTLLALDEEAFAF